MKILITILALAAAFLLGAYNLELTNWLLENGAGWDFAFAGGAIVAVIMAIGVLVLWLKSSLKSALKWIVALGSLAAIVGLFLAMNPPYIEDWSKTGEAFQNEDFENNAVELHIQQTKPDYDGLVCIASADCDHCAKSVRKLSTMHTRVPDLDMLVMLYTLQESKIDSFRVVTDSPDIPMVLVPDQDGTLAVTQGGFPTFIYVRNGQIIHRWHNDTFGYPAHAWVENRLN